MIAVRLLVATICLAAMIYSTAANGAALPDATQDILIRNVTLIDQAAGVSDRTVNILVRAGKLEIITEDTIPASEADLVEDAGGGFVLGKLEVGSPPSFMILSDDPRERFDVLLDTQTYTTFAIHRGEVVKDRLQPVQDEPQEEEVASGWLAYTPPPMAVPLDYRDASKWNRFEAGPVSGIFLAGLLLDRINWLSQDSVSEGQVGDVGAFEGGEIRGFRVGIAGTLNWFEKPWIYSIFGATNAYDKGFVEEDLDSFSLLDWRLDIPFFKNSVLSIGKQKEPFSGERMQSMIYNAMQERSSVSDALLPARNVGIVWSGSNTARYSSWAFGIFNDWLDANQDLSDSASQFAGRVTWAPLRSADGSNLLHLGLSYRYSDAKEGFRFATEPEFNQAPVYVDTGFGAETGVLPADNLQTWNGELAWRRGPYWVAAEYTRSEARSPALGDPVFQGYWLAASWILTGEMRGYNLKNGTFGGAPVSRSVYQNGRGTCELNARWSTIDLDEGAVRGGKMNIASLGLTWWATTYISVSANYRYIWSVLDGPEGTSSGFNTRLVLALE